MKFPGGDYLRKIQSAFFPSDADMQADRETRLAAIAAELDAKEAAQAAREQELRLACAAALRP